jgi:hypothetical protein
MIFLFPEARNSIAISMGEGDSIIIHAHFDFIEGPQPFRRNFP